MNGTTVARLLRIMSSHLVIPVLPSRDQIRGPKTAPVTLLEFGDYQCPHCGAAHPIVEGIRRQLGRQMRFVFRHFPLVQIHPRAHRAAEAAEAAGAQGEFWEMHDQLFEHQNALEDDDLLLYAAEIGIEVCRFARELAAGTYRPRVREDLVSGAQSGVIGTPTFFINGMRHIGGYDAESLLAGIQRVATAQPAAAQTRVR
jgi:protein-disulfide isomerase